MGRDCLPDVFLALTGMFAGVSIVEGLYAPMPKEVYIILASMWWLVCLFTTYRAHCRHDT